MDDDVIVERVSPEAPPPRLAATVPSSLFVLIILTQFPAALTLTVTAPLLADMAADLLHPGASPFLIKLITGIVGPAMMVGAPFAGWLADRLDRRPLLAVFGTVFILSAMAPAFLDGVGWIVAARFVSGACGGGLMTIGLAMVGYYYGEERRPGIIGIMAFLTLAVSIVALPIAGAAASSGWRHAFFMFPVMTPLVLLALRRPLPAPVHETDPGTPQPPGRGGLPRIPFALLVVALVAGLALNLPGILYSFYFAEIAVKDVGTVSLLLMYQAAVAGIATLLFGRVSRCVSPTAIFAICFACTAIGLGTQGLTTDYRLAGLSLTFTGISMGWLLANVSTATIALVDKRDHGAAIGIAQALGALATLLGISDVLQTSLGIKGIFLAVAAISALLALGLATGALPLRRMGSRP